MFAWEPSELPGVPREVIEHHLAVRPGAHPVKQKARRQAKERQDFIEQEVLKLEAAGVVRRILYPTWTANPTRSRCHESIRSWIPRPAASCCVSSMLFRGTIRSEERRVGKECRL